MGNLLRGDLNTIVEGYILINILLKKARGENPLAIYFSYIPRLFNFLRGVNLKNIIFLAHRSAIWKSSLR
jgi:hypothetical protein